MGLEDWAMVSAAALTVVFLVQFVFGIKEYGLGAHTSSVTMEQSVSGIKVCFKPLAVSKSLNSPR
jgi:hypothetical protein